MNSLDLLGDVLDVSNAGTGCPCGSLPHVAGREDSPELLEVLTTLLTLAAPGDSFKHAVVVVLATGYAIGASDAVDAMAIMIPDTLP